MPDKQLHLGEDNAFLALQSAWQRVLEGLAEQVNKPSYESWVKTAAPTSIDGSVVCIAAASRFAKHWLESKHLGFIRDVLQRNLGMEIEVRLGLAQGGEAPIMAERLPKRPRGRQEDEPISQPLNGHYTFESFVVGPNSRLAHACACAIADSPGSIYNPLFIYGGPGVGKTHLTQAIGHYVLEKSPETRVMYVSGETFTHHYISSLRDQKINDFRRRYRSVELWLVDDVHFLVGKERTEEEFFHTYNAVYDMGKQIVLTSDRGPKDLELDTRLLSRFEMGMLADISPPDLETRIAILQSKAAADGLPLPDDVVLYVARLITGDVRELQGALIKLHAFSSLMQMPITLDLAEQVVGKYYGSLPAATIDPQRVQKEVARQFQLQVADLRGACRSREVVAPRQIAMYLTRELTDYSLPAIGKAFGGRDHSTVIHACKKVGSKVKSDKPFAALVDDLAARIRNGHGR